MKNQRLGISAWLQAELQLVFIDGTEEFEY